jgi:hypothetical protein
MIKGQTVTLITLIQYFPSRLIKSVIGRLETWFKKATKPNNDRLVVGTVLDLTRSKSS